MTTRLTVASFRGLKPATRQSSQAGKGASKKVDTRPELALRRAVWKAGLRYRKHNNSLPGKPDLVFSKAKVVVFCDGDFWHGKDWQLRQRKLQVGSNAAYWLAKIKGNIKRDKKNDAALRQQRWFVLRFWESEIHLDVNQVVAQVRRAIKNSLHQGEEK